MMSQMFEKDGKVYRIISTEEVTREELMEAAAEAQRTVDELTEELEKFDRLSNTSVEDANDKPEVEQPKEETPPEQPAPAPAPTPEQPAPQPEADKPQDTTPPPAPVPTNIQ